MVSLAAHLAVGGLPSLWPPVEPRRDAPEPVPVVLVPVAMSGGQGAAAASAVANAAASDEPAAAPRRASTSARRSKAPSATPRLEKVRQRAPVALAPSDADAMRLGSLGGGVLGDVGAPPGGMSGGGAGAGAGVGRGSGGAGRAGAGSGAGSSAITRWPRALNERRIELRYPPAARARKLTGRVELELEVGADGRVHHASVRAGAGEAFDKAALEYARKLRFTPALAGQRAVAVRIAWTVNFRGVR